VPKNKMTDLRDHLFETIEALKDPDKPMEIQRAEAITHAAQAIVNVAKVRLAAAKMVADSQVPAHLLDSGDKTI
jgi:hypothetical protein